MSAPRPDEAPFAEFGLIPSAPRPSWREVLADPLLWSAVVALLLFALPVVVGFLATPPAPTP